MKKKKTQRELLIKALGLSPKDFPDPNKKQTIKKKNTMKKNQPQPQELQETTATTLPVNETTSMEVEVTNQTSDPTDGQDNVKETVVDDKSTSDVINPQVEEESPSTDDSSPESDEGSEDEDSLKKSEVVNEDLGTEDYYEDEDDDEDEEESEGPVPYNEDQECYTAIELVKHATESIPCLIGDLLPKTGLIALCGNSDSGKSTFARDLALAISTEQSDFLGWEIKTENKGVLYVSTEDDPSSIGTLLKKQVKGIPTTDDGIPCSLQYMFRTDRLLRGLNEELEDNPVSLIIIDTFADVCDGDMNNANSVRNFLQKYSDLARRHQCLILFVHHTSKGRNMSAPSKHNVLGSQSFEAKMRLVLELREDQNDDTLRHLCVLKGNYLPNTYKGMSTVLKFNEHMRFENTGESVPLSMLTRKEPNPDIARAFELKKQGMRPTEIGENIGKNKGTVSKWLKDPKNVALYSDKATDKDSDKK